MYYVIFVIKLYLCLLSNISSASPNGIEEFIINGRDVTDPVTSVAALYYDGEFICGATVITSTTLLTAAQCVRNIITTRPTSLFYAVANINRTAPQFRIWFNAIIPHPQYNFRTSENDVAIMKTSQAIPIDGDSHVRSICLAGPDYVTNDDDSAIVYGWGRTSNILRTNPEILQYAEQVLISNSECSLDHPSVTEDNICAQSGRRIRSSDICTGDYGGPLVSTDNPPVQIGIASNSNDFLTCGGSAVYASVRQYARFIREAANDTSVCFN